MSERWKISEHARQRMGEMSLVRKDVLTALANRSYDYPGSPGHPPGRRVACDGRLAVVYEAETRTVITVLWHGKDFVRPEYCPTAS